MTKKDINTSLYLLKELEKNLNLLSRTISQAKHLVSNMENDWIALRSKFESCEESVGREIQLTKEI